MRLALPFLALIAACSGNETNIRTLYPEISVTPPALESWTAAADTLGPVRGAEPRDVIVGEVATMELFVSNAGRANLDLSLQLDGEGFALEAESPTSLEPDELRTYVVTFEPQGLEDYEGTLTVLSNDDDTPSIEVPLRGRGIEPPTPDIEVDPLSVDFGDVDLGDTKVRTDLQVASVGTAPLRLGTLRVEGSPAFAIAAGPTPGGEGFEEGSVPVVLTYTPFFANEGDDGELVIPSNDPDEPEIRVALTGNGGGGGVGYPAAVIADCPTIVEISGPDAVRLDGSGSSDPAKAYPLTYSWQTARVPAGSATMVDVVASADPTITIPVDVAGEYDVLLTVQNNLGTPSAPALCTLDVVPLDDIRVELSWDGALADLDLHLLNGVDTAMWDIDGDMHFCNADDPPDWGSSGTDDDPRLDVDDRGGYGPENINIYLPEDGAYPVRVHYYATQGDLLVTAKVAIWADGNKVWEGSQVMDWKQVWEVGQVNWPEGNFAPSTQPLYDATGQICPTDG